MIQPQSFLNVADNSGAKKLMCIRVLGGSYKQSANIGDVIIAVVKDAIPTMPMKKSDIDRCIIIKPNKSSIIPLYPFTSSNNNSTDNIRFFHWHSWNCVFDNSNYNITNICRLFITSA